MRVLLTVDGSPGADTATALVGNLAWASATEFDVLSVVESQRPDVRADGALPR